jgi:hypothetical protein
MLPVILWQGWETLEEAREEGEAQCWRAAQGGLFTRNVEGVLLSLINGTN